MNYAYANVFQIKYYPIVHGSPLLPSGPTELKTATIVHFTFEDAIEWTREVFGQLVAIECLTANGAACMPKDLHSKEESNDAKLIAGFDYKTGDNLSLTRIDWREPIEKPESDGGFKRHVGGDLCVFSQRGKILFEVYDKDVPAVEGMSI